MAKRDYVLKNNELFASGMQKFKLNIPTYSGILGLSAGVVTAQAADADYFSYIVQCQGVMIDAGQQMTAWRDLLRYGGTAPVGGAPVLPAWPTAVTAVVLGIEARFRALVQQIKTNPNYNPAMGEALGIEGDEQTGPDLAAIQPVFTLAIVGNHVEVRWTFGGFAKFLDQCELQVDRNDGQGRRALATDSTPGYNDTQPFPATPTKWTYWAIFRVGDGQVGLWSNPVTITVSL